MADIRNTGTWQRVERGLSDMANLISRGEYNLALVKGRQTMEQIVRIQAGQNFVAYTDLADTIEKLYEGQFIEKDARNAFHTIRVLGNKAVHEGDNNRDDASRSYEALAQEIGRFTGRTGAGMKRVEELSKGAGTAEETERIRVPIERQSRMSEGRRYDRLDDRDRRDRRDVPTREDRLRAQRSGKKGGSGRQNKNGRNGAKTDRGGTARGQRKPQKSGLTLYDILRILIPAVCIILLVVLIRGLMSGSSDPVETSPVEVQSTEAITEPVTAVPPTTEAETTEAAAVRYRIKGNAVNIRYADNENRVYEQLSDGTEIGEVEEIEGTDKVKFVRDGIEVTVNRNYIEPIEDTAQ